MPRSSRVVIVTGGARGVGLACCRRFATAGYSVVIADDDETQGLKAQDEIRANGAEGRYLYCHVGDRLDLHNMLAATLEAYDRVDVLVNHATVMVRSPFLDLTEAQWSQVMDVNLKGAFLASQVVARRMISQAEAGAGAEAEDGGYAIVNISSVGAIVSEPDAVAFSVSQGGLNQLTRGMALALAPYQIRVNAIGPGNIQTEALGEPVRTSEERKALASRTPLGRLGKPEEVASIAYFLASSEASFITGQCIYADGGRLVQGVPMSGRQ